MMDREPGKGTQAASPHPTLGALAQETIDEPGRGSEAQARRAQEGLAAWLWLSAASWEP